MKQNLIANSNKRWQGLMILAAAIISAVKLWAWLYTESNIILTDLAESIVHLAASTMGLYALILSSKPKDEKHPYGKGKIEYLSAGVEGALVVIAGLSIIIKASHDFFVHREVHDIDVGIMFIAGVGLVNYILGTALLKRGVKYNAIILESHGRHLKTDAYSSLGLLAGLVLLYFFPSNKLDNAIAIVFGIIIGVNGYSILKKAVEGIMDQSDTALIQGILKHLEQHRGTAWIDLKRFRLVKYGSNLHADAVLTLPYFLSIEEMHEEVDAFKQTANNYTGRNLEVFLDIEPCKPAHCKNCMLEACKVRKHPYENKLPLYQMKAVKTAK